MSPTARSLAWLRAQGFLPAVVEKWNPGARVRQDLFGFLDIIALRPGRPGLLGVQVTTVAHQADRMKKARACAAYPLWMASNDFVVHGWAKRGPRGQRKVWTLVEVRDLEVPE
jgi:hypothetical protein